MSWYGMKDGQKKVIVRRKKVSTEYRKMLGGFKVTAERIDADTPLIHLEYQGHKMVITDSEARLLMDDLQEALRILPTSK